MKKRKLSPLLSDSISLGEIRRRKSIFRESEDGFGEWDLGQRINVKSLATVKFFLIFILSLFLLRLFQLTVLEGSKNRDYADSNRIRLVGLEAKRGKILDRNGKILAASQIHYFLNKDGKQSAITGSQFKELEKRGLAGENFEGELGKVSREVTRVYPNSQMTSHVLGYTSVAQASDLGDNPSFGTLDFVGRLGVEQSYDQVLRGVNGRRLIEVDAIGKTISVLGEVAPRDGQDITLTIDGDLQKKAFEAMTGALSKSKSRSGAIVISNPQTGEVLALLSFPAFKPDDVGRSIVEEEEPLFNRAIAGNYPPGSVFKIVSAVAGLQSGKITQDTEIEDVGEFELGGVKFPNWFYVTYGGRDGILKIDRAIARSNDIFFYRLGERVGLEQIKKWAIAFGFGQKTGVDLPGESFGLVPDEVWKVANLSDNWYLGDTLHLAIGQGFVTTTPLQVNLMTAQIASGKKIVPHVVSRVESQGGPIDLLQSTQKDIEVSVSTLELVRSGMRQACQEKGTAWPFFKSTYAISCKTGTAERTLGNPHAWFTAYAPSDFPEIAITVIIENGGEGSSVAAPVAKEILDWWFENSPKL